MGPKKKWGAECTAGRQGKYCSVKALFHSMSTEGNMDRVSVWNVVTVNAVQEPLVRGDWLGWRGPRTSSFMPVSSSSITQASMGRAISRPLRFRCSSKGVPKAGFSAHLSRAANCPVRHSTTSRATPSYFLPQTTRRDFFLAARSWGFGKGGNVPSLCVSFTVY